MLKNSTKRHEQKNRCCHRKSDPQPHGEAPSIAERLRWGGSQQTENQHLLLVSVREKLDGITLLTPLPK